ncbi:MAG: DUF4124 domain-containing protein [Betaproteobacteria bacterium]|nr:DUF4124 domain-containing protein [Betaproteobacteria bacterium]PWB63582.1 MAG: hypothetical protein C3F16_04825 [Betaproteobacteria bacterium]
MRAPGIATLLAFSTLAAAPVAPQEFYRCTSPDGKVTYQQAPCPKSDEERKVDATPANTDVDMSQREELLRKGEEAGKRLEERAAREAEEARRRREREEQLEREAAEREAMREPIIIYGGWPARPVQPVGPRPPRPAPRPVQPAPR